MFLPQEQEPPTKQKPEVVISEPPRLLRLKTANSLSIVGFWFLLGVALANLSRIIPSGWIVYWVAMLGVCGFRMFTSLCENAIEEDIATRRISGFALALSCFAFWDWVLAVASLPIHIFLWILPAWQCALLAIVALMLLSIVIGLMA